MGNTEKKTELEGSVQEQLSKNFKVEKEIIEILITNKIKLNDANLILDHVKKIIPTYWQFS